MISSQDGTEDRLPRAALRPWRAAGSPAGSAGAVDAASAGGGTEATGAADPAEPADRAGAAAPESVVPGGVTTAAVSSRAWAIRASRVSGISWVSWIGRA